MRRIIAATTAALATTALIAIPATQASARANHSVNISGTMFITDDESWPSSDEHRTVSFNASVVVGTNITQTTYIASGCAGGEVRIEATFIITHTNDSLDRIRVAPSIRMYEGTSCSSSDLDGTSIPSTYLVSRNGTATKNFSVQNTAEGGDHAELTVSIANVA